MKVIEECRNALIRVKDLKGILDIRDKAAAIKNYLKAKNEAKDVQVSASLIVALAEARAGQLIKKGQDEGEIAKRGGVIPRKGKTAKKRIDVIKDKPDEGESLKEPKTLVELGIDDHQSSRFKMAAEVLEKDPQWFDSHKDQCITNGHDFTQKAVIRRARQLKCDEIASNKVPPPEGEYEVIVIDPPWDTTRVDYDTRPSPGNIGFDYPTMTEEQLADTKLPATDNCHLWVWTTQRFLPMSLRLMSGWGFKYVCTFVWVKSKGMQVAGLPYYNCEFAVYGRKGTAAFSTTKGLYTANEWPRGAHSEKPGEFYEMVEKATSGCKRIDMFSRQKRKGFDSWGNQSPDE